VVGRRSTTIQSKQGSNKMVYYLENNSDKTVLVVSVTYFSHFDRLDENHEDGYEETCDETSSFRVRFKFIND